MMASENNLFVALNDHKVENSTASDERRRSRNTLEDIIRKKSVFGRKEKLYILVFLVSRSV